MAELKVRDEQEISTTPEVSFEIVVDFGEDGTMTVFSSNNEDDCRKALDKLLDGDTSDVDINEDELQYIEGISMKQTLEERSDRVEVIDFGGLKQFSIELYSAKVDKKVADND